MKKLAIAGILLIVISSVAFSQALPGGIAREVSLGGSTYQQGVVLNPFAFSDATYLYVNPAYVWNYRDYGWSNLAGGSDSSASKDGYGYQNAGINFALNDQWAVGTILSYDPSYVNSVISLPGDIMQRTPQTIPQIQDVWEVMIANHSGSTNLGFGFMYGWSNNDMTDTWQEGYTYSVHPPRDTSYAAHVMSSQASASMFGFRAGINTVTSDGTTLDLSGQLRFTSATDNRSYTPLYDTVDNSIYNRESGNYSASGTEFQLDARAKFHVSSKFDFVPYGQLGILSVSPKEDQAPNMTYANTLDIVNRTEKVTGTNFTLGAGGEYHSKGFYIVGGVSFQSMQIKYQETRNEVNKATEGTTYTYNDAWTDQYTGTNIPVINLGTEWWFTDWLAGRLGYYRAIGKLNYQYNETYTEVQSVNSSPGVFTNTTYTYTETYETNTYNPSSNVSIGSLNSDGLATLGL